MFFLRIYSHCRCISGSPGTGVLLVLTFLTSAVANRVANRILLARHSIDTCSSWISSRKLSLWDIGGFLRYPVSIGIPWSPTWDQAIWLKQVPMAKHSLFLSLATSAAQFQPQTVAPGGLSAGQIHSVFIYVFILCVYLVKFLRSVG